MSLNPGDIIDNKYRIVRLLGEGGMGAVYEGENTRIHRRVAIKVLHSQVASSQDAVQRFEREAQAAGRIGSEHIVEVLDLGNLPEGDRYMVMEFLEGSSLSSRIAERGKLPAQMAASVIVQLLEGLRAAHDAGIIHRDLKPDNVYLLSSRGGKKDFVKILDFGISKFNTLGGEFSMTRTGAVMGTPYYMSPEQAKGNRDIDLRADLYAVGVIMYEAVAGEVPFNAETFNELLFKIVLESPTPLVDKVPGIDPYFAAIVEKAMAREPAHRFQTATELSDAISGWLAGAPPAPDTTVRAGTPAAFERTALGMAGSQLSQSAGGNLARSSSGKIAAAAQTNAGEPVGASPNGGVGRATQGAWAATGDYGNGKSNTTKIIVAAAAVLVLAIGGGTALMLKSNQAEETARATAAAKVEEERAAAEKLAHEQARLEAERSRAEAEKAKAEQARLVQEKDMTAAQLAELKKLEAERAEAERLKAEAAGRRPAAPRPAAPRPTPTVKPDAPAAPASTGRVIRQDL
jgi:serine/threonine-protein kinase